MARTRLKGCRWKSWKRNVKNGRDATNSLKANYGCAMCLSSCPAEKLFFLRAIAVTHLTSPGVTLG
ncbi:hypothetical protein BGW80DRAFT_1228038 [Lactifluus volemus]|nr:hypothetical protein BGW80DRAFT_1228038 [Lactifluus volemus]